MIDGNRVIAVTPAGRRRYLDVLIPYVLRDKGVIDEYHLWVNTLDQDDVDYIHGVAAEHPDFIKAIPCPVPINPANIMMSIYSFFAACTEPNTVYVRFDDDITFIESGAVERLVKFRLENPNYFLVFGNIVNNAICSHIHQRLGKVSYEHGVCGHDCLDEVGWKNPRFAELCHATFLDSYLNKSLDQYKFSRWELPEYPRFSINVISWTGEGFARFGGVVGHDEEPWLTEIGPKEQGQMCCICGDALFSHYAFHTQREYLDGTNLLELYRKTTEIELA